MIVFTQLKQRKGTFQKGHLYENVNMSTNVSRTHGSSSCVSNGGRLVFVDPGAKINSEYYCEHVLKRGLLPVIQATCGRHNLALQQDGAPSHTARNTINCLHQENVNFIEPEKWPPNNPDLNPVD